MALGVEVFTQDNLVTATKGMITDDLYQIEVGSSVVRGELLKRGATGLIPVALAADVPFCVALETIDATAAAKDINYMIEGSVLESQMTFAAGTIADFRDRLRAVGIITER